MNIVIAGGGFGGVRAALQLARHARDTITLISDRDYFQYSPSLYSTATGRSQAESWIPLDTIFAKHANVRVIIDSVTAVDPATKQLTGASGASYQYDSCILALGAVTTYFSIEGLPQYSYGVKSKQDIHQLKHHLHRTIVERGEVDRNIVIVGGGATGVELAAAMSTYIRSLHKRYQVPQQAFTVHLIEASPRLLPGMSQATSRVVARRLERLGVSVALNSKVEQAAEQSLRVNGQALATETVIWTAGTTNHPFYQHNKTHFTQGAHGRVQVDEYLQAAPDVYVIGDNASTPHAGLAQTALYDGSFVARNLQRAHRGQARKSYKPRKPPVVVPVGRRWAVLEWGWLRVHGPLGAIVRRFADLIGYMDILPLAKALALWQWGGESEDAYLPPAPKSKQS